MLTSKARPCGADSAVPTPPARPAAAADLLEHIADRLYRSGASNQNERITQAIVELITAGVDTRPQIVSAAVWLGFNRGHAGAMLGRGREWARGDDGAYRLVAG